MHPLTNYRNLNVLSMEAFADSVGASKGMVSKWERWLARPNERYMQLIFEVTGGTITPNDFYRIQPLAQQGVTENAHSPDYLPSGESGARFANIDCAPVAICDEVAR